MISVNFMNIKVSDLTVKYFGGYLGVDKVSFDTNESIAIYGHTLSGKTSLLRAIANLEKFEGLVENSAKDMAFTFDLNSLKKSQTVYETLLYPLKLRGIQNADEIINLKSKTFLIEDILSTKIKDLNLSQKRIVILTRAMLRDNDLYLLDNPLKDVENREVYFKILLKEIENKFVLYSTDELDEAKVFNKILLLSYKKCIGFGTIDELLADPKTVDVYKLLTPYTYEYIIINEKDGKYYINLDSKEIEVPSPISNIYNGKEVLYAKDTNLVLDVYFDASTEYRISKR